jgi:hypothetical protein
LVTAADFTLYLAMVLSALLCAYWLVTGLAELNRERRAQRRRAEDEVMIRWFADFQASGRRRG